MKLKFKHQQFQDDAVKAVVDVFQGQPCDTLSYMIDRGGTERLDDTDEEFTGWKNNPVARNLTDEIILGNINKVQGRNKIKLSEKVEGKYNLTIEMETGVGKTYTYIKTMYELNKAYGWSKFIIIVPNIAVREGVYKTFQVTQEHFLEQYGKKIRFFIYNSERLNEIDRFASDNSINVMIINMQAFNSRKDNAKRIYKKLDEFRSRRPIDVIAKTNPILIIDEPQSVEGTETKKRLTDFSPILTLRYSATHKKDSIYNMVYRLDAMEAYNKKLVKKISVKGISETGNFAADSYVYLESINLSKADPTATIQFDCKGARGIRSISRTAKTGFNIYDNSGNLEEYRNNFIIKSIDGSDNSIEFLNGIKMYVGQVIGKYNEEQLRRIQIRETILSHIERERQLFSKGIKVLSLFFIDEVAKYKRYDENGQELKGIYAEIFEEEYNNIVSQLKVDSGEEGYIKYLEEITAESTHAGYFYIDKKGRMADDTKSYRGTDEKEKAETDAYNLIMRNKELLLDRNPRRSPVRFIFSHSALREGWDNPNVFQICTLKQGKKEERKRQEIGRGLRLCVNQDGERMDENVIPNDVHNVNVLTVIASESYESFAKSLQTEIAEVVSDRPKYVSADLFVNKIIGDSKGNKIRIDKDTAEIIYEELIENGYIRKRQLTDKYYADKAEGKIKLAEEVVDFYDDIISIIGSVYDEKVLMPENAREKNIEINIDRKKLEMPEFRELWSRINQKTIYSVDFDSAEIIEKSVCALNQKLHVSKVLFMVETGSMNEIESKSALMEGTAFRKERNSSHVSESGINTGVKYDIIGKIVEITSLTRKDITAILKGIRPDVFEQLKENPEEFITKAGGIINEEKARAVISGIKYKPAGREYDMEIFTENILKGTLGKNALKTKKHLYDHVIYDSETERKFAEMLETSDEVAFYVKLPNRFYISTPAGKYNPDWAIAFHKDKAKNAYFIAETKGSSSAMHLREVEKTKISCAEKHFRAIGGENIIYSVVENYDELLKKVK